MLISECPGPLGGFNSRFEWLEFSFVEEDVHRDWIDLLLGPFDDSGETLMVGPSVSWRADRDAVLIPGARPESRCLYTIKPGTRWQDIAVQAGLFPSKSQAMRGGWSGDLPRGYTERRHKATRRAVFVVTLMLGVNDSETEKEAA